jgi:hypothetical protein
MGTDWLGVRRTLGAVTVVAMLLASGCAQSGARAPISSPTDQSGATSAQLTALRSVPASEPMTGPRVPELFSLNDARKVCGFEGVRITAQTG